MRNTSLCYSLLVLSLIGGCSGYSESEYCERGFFFEGDFLKTDVGYMGVVQEVYDGQGDDYYQALVLIDNPRPDVTGVKVLAIFFPGKTLAPEVGELVIVRKAKSYCGQRARVYLARRSKGPEEPLR